jgi:hypothetical protein
MPTLLDLMDQMSAGGPGSGRHKEAGKFKQVNQGENRYGHKITNYNAPSGAAVKVHDFRGSDDEHTFAKAPIRIKEFDGKSKNPISSMSHPVDVAKGELRSKYGINYK